jgi:catechol 2,3-dioxygenase-like lactoylglutathione lyase family enzyme
MLHHLSFGVANLARSAAFYDAVLAPLGFTRAWAHQAAIVYGPPGDDDKFAIKRRTKGLSIPGRGFDVAEFLVEIDRRKPPHVLLILRRLQNIYIIWILPKTSRRWKRLT